MADDGLSGGSNGAWIVGLGSGEGVEMRRMWMVKEEMGSGGCGLGMPERWDLGVSNRAEGWGLADGSGGIGYAEESGLGELRTRSCLLWEFGALLRKMVGCSLLMVRGIVRCEGRLAFASGRSSSVLRVACVRVPVSESRRGKEKRQEPEVEEVLTLKRTKRSSGSRSSELQEGLRERDTLTAALVDRVRDKVPGMEIGSASRSPRTSFGEKEVGPLQKHFSAAEIKIRELEKELAAAKSRSEKVKKDLATAESRAEKAEKAEEEAMEKMKDANSLARFICSDEAIAKEFLTAFANMEVGDRLVWVYGQWAFTSGCRTMQEQVQTALTESLEETDLLAVLALLPGEVATPVPNPTRSRAHRSDRPAGKNFFLLC
nr:serine/arginine repetitive matrix protein 2-like [Ipomoea batatas]